MTDKPAGRKVEVAEPGRRLGAAVVRTTAAPPPANDNAQPLLARLASVAGFATLLVALAALVYALA